MKELCPNTTHGEEEGDCCVQFKFQTPDIAKNGPTVHGPARDIY